VFGVVCGVWCVVCGVWCVVCVVCGVCGVWCVVCGVWCGVVWCVVWWCGGVVWWCGVVVWWCGDWYLDCSLANCVAANCLKKIEGERNSSFNTDKLLDAAAHVRAKWSSW
jgi:hypothetical protein